MMEWLAEQLIQGTPTYKDTPMTYVEAVAIISNTADDDEMFKKNKNEFDNILIVKGYDSLIKKI